MPPGVNVPVTVFVAVSVGSVDVVKVVGSAAPATPGSSVSAVLSLVPLPSASKLTVP